MATILTDDPVAYQYLVKHALSLEQLAGTPVLPTVELVNDLTDAVADSAAPNTDTPDTGTPGTELEAEAAPQYVPAFVRGAVRVHAVEIRQNRQRRRAERYTLCDRSRTRVVDQAQYHASLDTVTCEQCRKRLHGAGALKAA